MVGAIAVVGDELQLLAGLGDEGGIDAIGDGGHKHIRLADGGHQLGLREWPVPDIEPCIEQLAHACFDLVRELSGDDDERLFSPGHVC
jgi:hypothetical protein